MPDDLWLTDPYSWSLQQAERLRRLRAGERVDDLDWDNVIEEIESVGEAQRDAVRSLLIQSVLHLLKLRAWPGSSAARKWRNDAADFLLQAQERYRPAMRQKIDMEGVLRSALRRLRALEYATPAQTFEAPRTIPLTILENEEATLADLDAALFPPP